MFVSSLIALTLLAFAATVQATSAFLQPPGSGPYGNYRDNPTYKEGEKMDIQWSSDLELMDVWVWTDRPGGFSEGLLTASRSTSMIWTVDFNGFDRFNRSLVPEDQTAVLYFALYNSSNYDDLEATSHYFNVTLARVESNSTSTTSSPTAVSDRDLSKGAVAGISVGVTLAGLLILCGVGIFVWRHFQNRRSTSKQMQAKQMPHSIAQKIKPPGSNWSNPTQELHTERLRASGPEGLYEVS